MTSKNLFFKLMKEDIKRRLWAVTLILLAFFFALPVTAAFMTGDINDAVDMLDVEKQLFQLTQSIQSLLSANNGFISFLVVTAAIICGCSSFSYLNSKKKVDFYHSIPVRRETLFFANYLNGILIVAIPYLINILMAVIISVLNGVSLQAVLGNALLVFLFQMIHYVMIYATVVIAMMMTGKLLVGILGTGIFFFYVPCMIFVIIGYFSTWFRTYYFDGMKGIEYSSPLMSYLENISQWIYSDTGFHIVKFLLLPALAGLILSGIGLVLYRIRPSESAGKAMAFDKSKSVIRILIVFVSALSGSLIFWQFRASMGWGLFGLICGCVISHCVIEIIYNSDFKKLFSHKIQLLVTGLFSLAVFLSFRYDWFGYDAFLPKANQVETASISFNYVDNWVTYGKPHQISRENYLWDYQEQDDYIFSNMRLTDVEDVLEIANAGILRNEELENYNYQSDSDRQTEIDTYYVGLSVEYQMKNGKKKRRAYYLPLSRVMENTSRIYNSLEYKKGTFPLLQMTVDELSYAEVMNFRNTTQITQNQKQLMETYQEEFSNLTLETQQKESPIATIRFVSNELNQAITATESLNSRDFSQYGYYPVYPSFTKTIDLLEQQGIDLNQEKLLQSAAQVSISDKRYYRGMDENEGETAFITDLSEQKEIIQSIVFADYMNYNYWIKTNTNIEVWISVDSENGAKEYRFYFLKDKLPSWVKSRIHYDERTKLLEEQG